MKKVREDRLIDIVNVQGEVEHGWAPSSVEVFLSDEE